MPGLDISVSAVVCQIGLHWKRDRPDARENDVMEHDPHRWLRPLTAVMIRDHTELCVRLDNDRYRPGGPGVPSTVTRSREDRGRDQ